ncbi:Arm DNA-binding domain-containing protein [Sphingobium sp. MK2]
MYLLVSPRGSKLWRIKYRIDGVERKLALSIVDNRQVTPL